MTGPLVILGATGSIGRQALDVASRLRRHVVGLGARRGSQELIQFARDHPEATVVAVAPTSDEREALRALGPRVRIGPEALVELARTPGAIVVNGVVGFAGLASSIAALEAGNRLALANKESLVAGGPLVVDAARRGGGELIPVDSEHSAVFQCLTGERRSDLRRLILTASGGPFFGRTIDQIEQVTPDEALAHPTWSMGPRVTVDSATLVNKGLEVIEAHFLFDVEYDDIAVVVHPQSVVHSLVEFVDGSLKAQLGEPDMRVPIAYAITYPDRAPGPLPSFDLTGRDLSFRKPDRRAFPALDVVIDAGRRGGSAPAVVNAADEIAVRAFLEGRLGFLGIAQVLERTLDAIPVSPLHGVDDARAADAEARNVALSLIGG